ncbi:Kelch repeat-containing protein [Adhaeribacter arboris]|uniref:Kelch repeat-containing protein n=1 Tax=Adhaeribacter arboris TaxID=2072846 RepID=UPI001304BE95|nr:cadherin domain-containing protein [Adhaeribacter arboris]
MAINRVKAASHKSAIVTATNSFTSSFSLVFGASPAFENKQYTFTLPENSALGTSVGTIKATAADGASLTYKITAGNTNQAFALDSTTGALTLAKFLNRHTQSSYQLSVRASDSTGLADSASVAITLIAPTEEIAVDKVTWSSLSDQPYIFYEGQGKSVNGKWYTFSGFDSEKPSFTPTSRSYYFDPAINTWEPIAPMPPMNGTNYGGVTHAGFTTDNNDIYFAGGYTANESGKGQILGTKEVWKYVVNKDRYERLPDLPRISATGQLEYLQGKLHYIAGTDRVKKIDLDDHYVLDLDNLAAGWDTLAPLPSARQHAGSAVYEGKIYFIGGQTGHDEGSVATRLVHVYDPQTNNWTRVADIPVQENTVGIAHISSSVVVRGNQIIVIGGEYEFQKGTRLVSAYSPATDTWDDLTPLPLIMRGGVATLIGGKLYYTGGKNVRRTYVGEPLSEQKIIRLALVNAENGEEIRLIGKGATVNLANLPTSKVSIRATTSPNAVGSVVFQLSGAQTVTQTESKLPYALLGDRPDSTYVPWNPVPGEYTLDVTPYSAAGGKGLPGTTLKINFTITDAPLVTNLTTTNNLKYELDTLNLGVPIYTDRTYVTTSVPEHLINSVIVKTPNDDKYNNGAGVFALELTRPATVYVAYDPRVKVLPGWLENWQKQKEEILVNDEKNNRYQLYSQSFTAGPITFDGNRASPAAGSLSNYFVVIKAQQDTSKLVTGIDKQAGSVNQNNRLLKVYPNPINKGEKLSLTLENFGKKEEVSLTLYDVAGRTMLTQNLMTNYLGNANLIIPVPSLLRSGVYIIKIVSASGTRQQKLVVQ